MRKFFVSSDQIVDNQIKILGEDVNHIKNVLRLELGNQINICDKDNSNNYICEIFDINREYIICKILEKSEADVEGNIELSVFQGLPKAEKMELIIQKCTELGAYDFTPVKFSRSIVKLNEKDSIRKIERWQKISEVASKQSKRDIVPKVNNLIDIKDLSKKIENYDLVLLAYENEDKNSFKKELLYFKEEINKKYDINLKSNIDIKCNVDCNLDEENSIDENIKDSNITNYINIKTKFKIAIIIGPEGGFDEKEVETLKNHGAKVVSLGKRILRTETAALAMISIIMYELET